ncbi:ATP-dependent Clp protease ATP-binding subunit [Philodulcilactobacillus myokoensis]|uniref:ATP-dependent Clp protease ATP-binding subunit n=2 Tax=Philodulcilactobacillus myokoensis TaxID=2929573 RepID=A0A9W6ESH3_9LACO|nr:ATP-dependent Clp protease ATP-binding subunit [Philodulcilactobacillus myokoensis]
MGQDPFGFDNFDDIFRAMGGNLNNNRFNGQQMNGNNGGRFNGNGRQNTGGVLSQYGINMTELAKQGKIDPVIGRDKEISRVIEILNRRTKNNPVLIGEAGVGKTAVVEGLALRIASGNVPEKLLHKEIIRLDVVSLVQGTGIRGQFEKRMRQLIKEVQANPNIILFIDEIHEIMGAGNAKGGMDAGNVLKPALARGEFQLLGATTMKEYRDIEKDSALARRFQTVIVNEPSPEEAIQILKGIQKKYEDYHHVKYTDDAIKAAVKLSDRYIQDRFLPDKAIDLIDEAGSRKNLTLNVTDPQTVEKQIKNAEQQKQAALKQEDYEKAAYYRDQETKLNKIKANGNVKDTKTPKVTSKDMEQIVEEITNIPVGELQSKEQQQLRNLAPDLKKNVIGQDQAVDKVAQAIKRSRIGFNGTGRPVGSFLFVGTTGVGKTELAKQLARQLFGTKDAMIRLDMSEYREPQSVAKLIGSAPGYVGYNEGGQLTEKVRRHPYSLILLDEVEKAHPDVLHDFLQVLDDGRLTDSQGRTVSFKDTVIIMTSNAGTGDSEANVGFGASAKGDTHSVINHLTDYFKPEFLNRFDDIIQFNQLNKTDLRKIVNLMLSRVNKMLAQQGFHIDTTPAAQKKIVDLGYNPSMGARPLRRVIQEQIEDKVADYYLDHKNHTNLIADVDSKNNIYIKSDDDKTNDPTASDPQNSKE